MKRDKPAPKAAALPRRANLHPLDVRTALKAAMAIKVPPKGKTPERAPRKPAAPRAEPKAIKGRKKAKGS